MGFMSLGNDSHVYQIVMTYSVELLYGIIIDTFIPRNNLHWMSSIHTNKFYLQMESFDNFEFPYFITRFYFRSL